MADNQSPPETPAAQPPAPAKPKRKHYKKPEALKQPLTRHDPSRPHVNGTPDLRSAFRGSIDDERVRRRVIGLIGTGATIETAASILGISAATIYDRKAKDPEFRANCAGARAEITSILASTAVAAARRVGTEAERPSDHVMLIFCLKNFDPLHWRDRKELEVQIGDIPGALREAAERARERKRLRAAVVLECADCTPTGKCERHTANEIVPFVAAGGNGSGGNGHG